MLCTIEFSTTNYKFMVFFCKLKIIIATSFFGRRPSSSSSYLVMLWLLTTMKMLNLAMGNSHMHVILLPPSLSDLLQASKIF